MPKTKGGVRKVAKVPVPTHGFTSRNSKNLPFTVPHGLTLPPGFHGGGAKNTIAQTRYNAKVFSKRIANSLKDIRQFLRKLASSKDALDRSKYNRLNKLYKTVLNNKEPLSRRLTAFNGLTQAAGEFRTPHSRNRQSRHYFDFRYGRDGLRYLNNIFFRYKKNV